MTKEGNKRRGKGTCGLVSVILSLLLLLQGFMGSTPVYADPPSTVQVNFSGELTAANTFYRPNIYPIFTLPSTRQISNFDGYSQGNDKYNYFTRSLTPDTTGNYTIEVTSANLSPASTDYGYGTPQAPIPVTDDTTLFLYDNSFDPASPMTGLLYANDDIASKANDIDNEWFSNSNNFKSRLIDIPLTAGQTYVLVVTSYDYGITGPIDLTVSGPGSLSVTGNQYSSDISTMTISGNAGIGGAVLSYTDGAVKTVTADSSGIYLLDVPSGWSGTVTPSKSGYTFAPANYTYTNINANQTSQNFIATPSSSSDAMLKAGSTVKGQTVSLGTPNATLGSETPGSVILTAEQAADTSNTGSYVTLFDPTDSNASSVKVVKYALGASPDEAAFTSADPYGNEAISNGDFFIIKVVAQDGTTALYYRENVTVTASSISLVSAETFTFDAATVGYGAQPPYSVNVKNTGSGATGELTIALSGTGAGSFTLDQTSISDIAAGSNTNFTVRPNTGLAIGTYTATVTVSGSTVTAQSFNVSFTVSPAGTTYTATIYYDIDNLAADVTGSVELKQGTTTITASKSETGIGIYTASAPNGYYSIYVNGVDTGRMLIISAGNNTATLRYYTVSFSATSSGTATGNSINATAGGTAISSGAVVLAGTSVAITASGTGAGSYTYAWSGLGTSGQTTGTLNIPSLNSTVNATCNVTGSGSPSADPDYRINDEVYNWSGSDQTIVLAGTAIPLPYSRLRPPSSKLMSNRMTVQMSQ